MDPRAGQQQRSRADRLQRRGAGCSRASRMRCIHADDRPGRAGSRGATRRDRALRALYRIVTAAGAEKWVLDRGMRVTSVDGSPAIELHARRHRAETIRSRAARIGEVLEGVSGDAERRLDRRSLRPGAIDVNEGFERLFACLSARGRDRPHLGRAGILGESDDRARLVDRLRRDWHGARSRSHRPYCDELRTLCLISGKVIEIGGRAALVLIVHDITEWREAEAAHRAQRSCAMREAQPLSQLALAASPTISTTSSRR